MNSGAAAGRRCLLLERWSSRTNNLRVVEVDLVVVVCGVDVVLVVE